MPPRRRRPGRARRGPLLQPPAHRRGAAQRRAVRQLPLQVRPPGRGSSGGASPWPSSAPCGRATTRWSSSWRTSTPARSSARSARSRVPAIDERRARASAARTPEEAEAARILAEANAALRSARPRSSSCRRSASCQTGMQRFDTLTTGAGHRQGDLLARRQAGADQEGAAVQRRARPRRRCRAPARSPSPPTTPHGDALAADEIQLNAAGNRFRVRLVEPQQGKRYASSLLARAEVEAPEGETVERVELYLNETRIATLYQPPYRPSGRAARRASRSPTCGPSPI